MVSLREPITRSHETRRFRGALTSPSSRERLAWYHFAMGKTTKEVADVINVSFKTADHYKQLLYEKLSCRNLADLTRAAVAHGIIHITPVQ